MIPKHHTPGCHLGADCGFCQEAIRLYAAALWHERNDADDLRVVS